MLNTLVLYMYSVILHSTIYLTYLYNIPNRFDKITGDDYIIKYSYNPCYSFTEGDGACYKAAVSAYDHT